MAKKKNYAICRGPVVDPNDTYRIVQTVSVNSLRVKVNHFIQEGWQPLGGPTFDGINWYQAMVIYEERES